MNKLEKAYEKRKKELFDPDYFFEYGMNPSFKNLQQIIGQNSINGLRPNYVTNVSTKQRSMFYWRDVTDIWERELRLTSFPLSLNALFLSTACFLLSIRFAKNYLPVGMYGVRNVQQTHWYKTWGYPGVFAVLAVPAYLFHVEVKTIGFCWEKFYNQIIMQERNWMYEYAKLNNPRADFHFNDSPFSTDNDNLAAEFAAHAQIKDMETPVWLTKNPKSLIPDALIE